MTSDNPTLDEHDYEFINRLYQEKGNQGKKEIYDDLIEVVKKYNTGDYSSQDIVDSIKLTLFEVCRCAVVSSKTVLENPDDFK